MEKLIIEIEAAIKHAQWELENSPKGTNNWYLTKGKLNGYNHILEHIKTHHLK